MSHQVSRSDTLQALPPHAPEGSWARRLLGRFHVTGIFWYRFHRWGVSFLPAWAVGIFVTIFTTFFFLTLIKIRRAMAENLVPVLGPCGFLARQQRIFRTMWMFAWCLSERYERLSTDRSFRVEADLARWNALFGAGRGLILVTAHVGNYEVGSMLPAVAEGRRVIVVREREVNPEAQEFVERLLASVGGPHYSVHFEQDDPLHGMELLDALREGAIVGIQGDRPRHGGKSVKTRLFGREIDLPAGPATLARLAAVPLVPIFVVRVGRFHYRVDIREPIEVALTSDRHADVAVATARVAAAIESAIQAHPHQWFCFRSLWPAGQVARVAPIAATKNAG